MIIIGIDPGVQTGVAVYNKTTKQLEDVKTMMLHDAMELVLHYKSILFKVRIEDARKRTGGFEATDAAQTKSGDGVREGVGSVKRDCKIWEDFLIAKGIPHEMVKPKNTKYHEKYFKQMTGWVQRCSVHGRDAAMLIFGM